MKVKILRINSKSFTVIFKNGKDRKIPKNSRERNDELYQINTRYNKDAKNLSISGVCSSFGGCPALSKLKDARDLEIKSVRDEYEEKMKLVGCDTKMYGD